MAFRRTTLSKSPTSRATVTSRSGGARGSSSNSFKGGSSSRVTRTKTSSGAIRETTTVRLGTGFTQKTSRTLGKPRRKF